MIDKSIRQYYSRGQLVKPGPGRPGYQGWGPGAGSPGTSSGGHQGGGGGGQSHNKDGKAGGSGIVVIAYPTAE